MDRSSRRLLIAAALVFLAAAFATTSLKVRGEGNVAGPVVPRAAPRPAATAFVAVMPRRDPFAGGTPPLAQPATSAVRPVFPSRLAGPVFPPIPIAPPAVTPPRVTAIVTGARPYALVDDRGVTRVVTVGERVAGESIVAIDIDGVRLEHGATLSVSPTSAPPGSSTR